MSLRMSTHPLGGVITVDVARTTTCATITSPVKTPAGVFSVKEVAPLPFVPEDAPRKLMFGEIVGAGVLVCVFMTVGDAVGVSVGVPVNDGVAVSVGVFVGVAISVGVKATVLVGVAVAVGV